MTVLLKQSTASQEVLLGPFLDDADGKTAETALSIANTDIKIWKAGSTSEVNKNSGGATHIASGRYYAVLDATDTNTLGSGEINVFMTGALPVKVRFCVLPANIYDSIIGGSDYLLTDVIQWNGGNIPTPDQTGYPLVDVYYWEGSFVGAGFGVPADVAKWNGSSVASPDSAGHPKVTVKSGTGTGEISLSSGIVSSSLSTDFYHADIQFTKDEANSTDEWTVTWFKNGVRQTAGITSPTLQLVKRADGTDLKTATTMTQIGTTGSYKLDLTTTDRTTDGEAVIAIAAATIDSGSRTFSRLISRDST